MHVPSPRSLALVVEGIAALVAARAGVRVLSIPRLLKAGRVGLDLIGRTSPDEACSASDVALAIHRASRVLPGTSTCLAKALAARAMLGRRGLDAQLRIGVRKNDAGSVEAHAWVEYQGAVVIGGDTGPFNPFPRPL